MNPENNTVFLLDVIKKTYLDLPSDLTELLMRLELELELHGSTYSEEIAQQFNTLCNGITNDIKRNTDRAIAVARLLNKISPPNHINKQQRPTFPPYLRRVK